MIAGIDSWGIIGKRLFGVNSKLVPVDGVAQK